MKKKDLVDHIENLKGKVVIGNDIQGLFNQISKLLGNVVRHVTANEKLINELLIVRNVNENLQNRIVNLESKSKQYNRCKNVEISGISSEVSDQNLEGTGIGICKDSEIDVTPLNTEGCHRLTLGRNATNTNKREIVKFVNRKHSEAMLQCRKVMNKKSKVYRSYSLCPYYRFLWGKRKELQRKGRVDQVFCLGAAVTARLLKKNQQSRFSMKKT